MGEIKGIEIRQLEPSESQTPGLERIILRTGDGNKIFKRGERVGIDYGDRKVAVFPLTEAEVMIHNTETSEPMQNPVEYETHNKLDVHGISISITR